MSEHGLTLKQWVEKLPPSHGARRSYEEMRQSLADQKVMLGKRSLWRPAVFLIGLLICLLITGDVLLRLTRESHIADEVARKLAQQDIPIITGADTWVCNLGPGMAPIVGLGEKSKGTLQMTWDSDSRWHCDVKPVRDDTMLRNAEADYYLMREKAAQLEHERDDANAALANTNAALADAVGKLNIEMTKPAFECPVPPEPIIRTQILPVASKMTAARCLNYLGSIGIWPGENDDGQE